MFKCPIPVSTIPNQIESTHHTPSAFFLQNSQHIPITHFIQFPSENYPIDFNKQLILAQEVQLSKSEYRKKYLQ